MDLLTALFPVIVICFLVGVTIYYCIKIVGLIFDAFLLVRDVKNTRLTNLHYYDHSDRYFDFKLGQWYQKQ